MKKLSDIQPNETVYLLLDKKVIDLWDADSPWKERIENLWNESRKAIVMPLKMNHHYSFDFEYMVEKKSYSIPLKKFQFSVDVILGFLDAKHNNLDGNFWHLINSRLNKVRENLSTTVYGQEAAVDCLISALISMELVNLCAATKSSLLISGPSGSGKTELMRNLPNEIYRTVFFDCSNLTGAGYKGSNVDDIVRLIQQEKKENPKHILIVFLDEIDKLAINRNETSIQRYTQSNLLKILEGTQYKLPIRDERGNTAIESVSTHDVMFVCAGAFSGAPNAENMKPQDFIDYGLLPELVGRMTHITSTKKLSKDIINKIIKECDSSALKRLTGRLKLFGVELVVSDDFINSLVEKAFSSPMGVRSLEQEIQLMMNPYWNHLDKYIGKTLTLSAASGLRLVNE